MQQKLTLVIGSKTLSSWSLRPWLFLRHHEVPFEEILVPLGQRDSRARILEHSPSGKLPCLLQGPLKVWESLAICEYAAETLALPLAWPMDPAARALARAMSTEMHAGFAELRRELPFDALRKPEPLQVGAGAAADIARVRALWREARSQHGRGGPWLFGRFGIADAMFAPVALRFHAYAVNLDGPEREYVFNVLMHPAVQDWLDAATLEQPIRETPAERTAEFLVAAEPEPAPALVPAPEPELPATTIEIVPAPLPPTPAPVAAEPLRLDPELLTPIASPRYFDDPAEASAEDDAAMRATLEELTRPRAATVRTAGTMLVIDSTPAAEATGGGEPMQKLRSFILPP
ncbi:glutathione S-transferase family protein [Solimonas sp. K1W22B-7]|nr:glutathione S-transferase family protein [Solimonas sp. K1W22B-7]AXQ31427.1 glutathione S-transferase family protein [Solimonas sp. K1W22B-7]